MFTITSSKIYLRCMVVIACMAFVIFPATSGATEPEVDPQLIMISDPPEAFDDCPYVTGVQQGNCTELIHPVDVQGSVTPRPSRPAITTRPERPPTEITETDTLADTFTLTTEDDRGAASFAAAASTHVNRQATLFDGELPRTGLDLTDLLLMAFGFIIAGVLMFALAQRASRTKK